MNLNFNEFATNVDGLRNLVRYQNAPRVYQETVAEHSYFVSAYVLKLRDIFEFNLEKALRISILHDYAESFISDVPHPIKAKFPLISKELKRAEFEINSSDISKSFAEELEEMNNLSTAEGCIVALADIISVLSYSKYEIGLGNSKYMYNVLENAKNRCFEMMETSRKYAISEFHYNELMSSIKHFCEI